MEEVSEDDQAEWLIIYYHLLSSNIAVASFTIAVWTW